MEQHPIPQQISSYEFKLVGEMTLKQFLKAAGGVVAAVLINSSGLVFFIKYPLMAILGVGGIALAFVPFQDRPLETWIMAFIKSIYSPTIFTYKKKPDKNWLDIDLTKTLPKAEEEENAEEEERTVKSLKKVNEFINSLPSVQKEMAEEEKRVSSEEKDLENVEIKDVNANLKAVSEDKGEKTEGDNILTNDKAAMVNPINRELTKKTEETIRGGDRVKLNLRTEKLEATGATLFGEIPMPDMPEVTNIIVGMATGKDGKIVEGAIVEIQDENGNPSRVLKTNALGQFRTLSPLANGKYLIITEKDNFNFDRVNVDLNGQIVKPIKIISL